MVASLKTVSDEVRTPKTRWRNWLTANWKTVRKNGPLLLFLAPLVIIIFAILIYPILKAAMMSFQHYYLLRPHPDGHPFVGLKNYRDLVNSPDFISSVQITLIYIVGTVLARYVLGLGAALLLNRQFPGRAIVRVIIILPWAIPVVVACLVWILMFDNQFGIINYLLERFAFISNPIVFLGDVKWALPSAMLVNIWKGFPWAVIMLLAGLQGIPETMYEAALVDGANSWQRFRYITLPLLRPVSAIVFLLLVVWTVKDFAILYVLTGGGPSDATQLLTVFVYKLAFKFFRMGQAAAGGMILLLFSLLFTVIYLKVSKGEEATW